MRPDLQALGGRGPTRAWGQPRPAGSADTRTARPVLSAAAEPGGWGKDGTWPCPRCRPRPLPPVRRGLTHSRYSSPSGGVQGLTQRAVGAWGPHRAVSAGTESTSPSLSQPAGDHRSRDPCYPPTLLLHAQTSICHRYDKRGQRRPQARRDSTPSRRRRITRPRTGFGMVFRAL